MEPYKNIVYHVRYSGLSRKRQIINAHLDELHTMHLTMIEDAVRIKEAHGFPEATKVLNYIKSL